MSSSFSLQTFQPPRHTSPQMEKCHHFQKNTTHTNSYISCLCRKGNVAEKKKKRKCFVINGGGGVPPKPQIHCQQTFCVQTSSSFLGHLQWLVGWGCFSCMEEVLQCCFSTLSYSARFQAIVIIDLGNLARVPNWSRMKKGEREKWLIKDHFMHDAASLCNGDGSSNSNRYFLDDRTSPCFSHWTCLLLRASHSFVHFKARLFVNCWNASIHDTLKVKAT